MNSSDVGIRKSGSEPLWRWLLWPLGLAFLCLARLRTWYLSHFSSPLDLGLPAISVGNLTFGGTGKTPVTIFLSRLLQEMGQRPAVLLRGYGRGTKGPLLAHPDSQPNEVGEEAILLARSLPGVPVAVGERRDEAAALVRSGCTVFVLDDAFQHLRVRRDVDLLLVDATRSSDLRVPPVGRLREFLGAARRASAVLVTRGSAHDLPAPLRPEVGGRPVLGISFTWARRPAGQGGFASWEDLSNKPLVAFAGVGNPDAFFAQADGEGLQLADRLRFEDHANPTPSRLALVLAAAEAVGATAVLTTEKDAVKWQPAWPDGAPPLVHPVLEVRAGGDVGPLLALLASACARAGR